MCMYWGAGFSHEVAHFCCSEPIYVLSWKRNTFWLRSQSSSLSLGKYDWLKVMGWKHDWLWAAIAHEDGKHYMQPFRWTLILLGEILTLTKYSSTCKWALKDYLIYENECLWCEFQVCSIMKKHNNTSWVARKSIICLSWPDSIEHDQNS